MRPMHCDKHEDVRATVRLERGGTTHDLFLIDTLAWNGQGHVEDEDEKACDGEQVDDVHHRANSARERDIVDIAVIQMSKEHEAVQDEMQREERQQVKRRGGWRPDDGAQSRIQPCRRDEEVSDAVPCVVRVDDEGVAADAEPEEGFNERDGREDERTP